MLQTELVTVTVTRHEIFILATSNKGNWPTNSNLLLPTTRGRGARFTLESEDHRIGPTGGVLVSLSGCTLACARKMIPVGGLKKQSDCSLQVVKLITENNPSTRKTHETH